MLFLLFFFPNLNESSEQIQYFLTFAARQKCLLPQKKSSAATMNQCQSGGWWKLIFKELKAKANKHLANRLVQWQRKKKDKTFWPLLMKIRPGRKSERDQRETATDREAVHRFTVSTLSDVIENAVNWWLTVWAFPVTAVTLNQRDLPGFDAPPAFVKATALIPNWKTLLSSGMWRHWPITRWKSPCFVFNNLNPVMK